MLSMDKYAHHPSLWTNNTWNKFIDLHEFGKTCASSWPYPDEPQYQQFFPVDYCLSQELEQKCQLNFSLPISITVILCNIIKVICMFLTAHDDRQEIFLTTGDALSSFLSNPDSTTEGTCFLSMFNIIKDPQSWKLSLHDEDGQTPTPKRLSRGNPVILQSRKRRWIRAASVSRWTLTISLFVQFFLVSSSF